jgi:DHA2 family multidrug resistance protein
MRGYDALMIGETMFVTGVAMFLTAPVAGRLSQVMDPRAMMLAGFMRLCAGHLYCLASPQTGISTSCWFRRSCAAYR